MRYLRVGLLLASGCISGYSTRDRVTLASREYNEGVRWGRYDQAVKHIPRERRNRFVERHQALEDELQIADLEVVSLDIDRGDKTAEKKQEKVTVRVEYSWTLKRVGLVHRTSTKQTWEEQGGEWVVAQEERVKGTPLSLFDEPPRR